MNTLRLSLLCVCLINAPIAAAQPSGSGHQPPSVGWAIPPAALTDNGPENPQDEGYRVYREGYLLVLDEQWRAAREKFDELVRKFPKSTFVDDAQYWSAYSLMQIDQKKAIEEYRSFLRRHQKSSYFPDALADMAQLEASLKKFAPNAPGVHPQDGRSFSYEIHIAPQIRRLEQHLRFMADRLPQISIAPVPTPIEIDDKSIDKATQLRMQALAALRETKEDEWSFQTLRTIAEDAKQPQALRLVAMNSLAGYQKFDALPIYVEVARVDTSPSIQTSAIYLIRLAGKDKDRRVDALEQVFRTIPEYRAQLLSSTLYSIAEVGNDRAVDFLGRVAQTNSSYELRSNAIFYLGNIGNERARTTLFKILQGD